MRKFALNTRQERNFENFTCMANMEETEKQDAEKSSSSSAEAAVEPQQDGAIRDNMVDLATRFLTNNRVQSSPMEQRRAFLKKKGLNDAEIDKAVKLAQQQGALAPASNQNAAIAGPPPLPPRPPTTPPRPRTWSEYAVMAAVVGGVGYAVVYFVRHYLIPWWRSPREQEQRLTAIQSSVDQLQASMTETVTSISQSTQAIRDLLSEQQQNLQLLCTQVSTLQTTLSQQTAGAPQLKEVKEELGALKGLLLSRHQFPPTPTRQGSQGGIPSWQRVQLPQASPSGQKTPQQNGQLSVHGGSESTSPTSAANGGPTEAAATGKDLTLSARPQEHPVQATGGGGDEQWHDSDD